MWCRLLYPPHTSVPVTPVLVHTHLQFILVIYYVLWTNKMLLINLSKHSLSVSHVPRCGVE